MLSSRHLWCNLDLFTFYRVPNLIQLTLVLCTFDVWRFRPTAKVRLREKPQLDDRPLTIQGRIVLKEMRGLISVAWNGSHSLQAVRLSHSAIWERKWRTSLNGSAGAEIGTKMTFFLGNWTHVSTVTTLLRDLNPGHFTDWATAAAAGMKKIKTVEAKENKFVMMSWLSEAAQSALRVALTNKTSHRRGATRGCPGRGG